MENKCCGGTWQALELLEVDARIDELVAMYNPPNEPTSDEQRGYLMALQDVKKIINEVL